VWNRFDDFTRDILRDAKDGSLRDEDVEMMYLPYRQAEGLNQMRVIVRSAGDPMLIMPSVRKTLHELSPQLPITDVAPITEQMGRTIAMERFTTLMSGFFGAVAMMLAAFGIYATVSHVVETRTTEIGVRMALGATGDSVLRMILRDHFKLIFAGLAAGIIAAAFAARAVSARLFGVSPADVPAFAIAVVVMLLTSFIAVLRPARRATRVDPAETLRYE
jgi:ABC-type lipoprotein release transport system permease subunit